MDIEEVWQLRKFVNQQLKLQGISHKNASDKINQNFEVQQLDHKHVWKKLAEIQDELKALNSKPESKQPSLTMSRHEILDRVSKRRDEQIVKWGHTVHADSQWLAVMMEEVGECSEEICQELEYGVEINRDHLTNELFDVAAVCVAWIEQLTTLGLKCQHHSETSGKDQSNPSRNT